jgi:hypothetical protein
MTAGPWSDGPVPTDSVLLRALAATGIAWGGLLLARPRLVAGLVSPEFPPDKDWVVRLLGARLVVQDSALFLAPTRGAAVAGAVVDGIHALSMLPWLGNRRYRRAAAVSGGVAAVGAVSAGVLARR